MFKGKKHQIFYKKKLFFFFFKFTFFFIILFVVKKEEEEKERNVRNLKQKIKIFRKIKIINENTYLIIFLI